jgi:hypothetical protein
MKENDYSTSKKINVEIAPGNQSAMDTYISVYNTQPDRKKTRLKYTDVVNEALDEFLTKQLKKMKNEK